MWITEGGWEAAVDLAAILDPAEVTLIHVTSLDVPGPRGRRHEQVVSRMHALAGEAAQALLDDAAERLGRSNVWTAAEQGVAETIVMDAWPGWTCSSSRATGVIAGHIRSGTSSAG